jgi:hypothetical protein
MNCQLIVRSFGGLAIFLAAVSHAFAQHGGHGGSGGHGGGGGHGGYSGGGGHSGYGGSHGGYGGGHGRYDGHSGYGGGHGYGYYGYHLYPQFDFDVSPRHDGYGYSSYTFPYYAPNSCNYGYYDVGTAGAGPAYVKQAQPSPTPYVVAKPVTTSKGVGYQRSAEAAFRAGDFEDAARLANHALVEMPRDGKLLLFAAQTLFAVGDYRSAAAAIHQATSLLGSEQWGYVVENYRQYYRGRAYVDQMARLDEYIKENPNTAHAYFLRGYQHGFLGHQKSTLRDLNKAVELESRDQLAAQLIERFGGTPPVASTPDLGEPPAAEGGGHKGHDHSSHGQSEGSNDNHQEAPVLPTSGAPFSTPLRSDLIAPLTVSE